MKKFILSVIFFLICSLGLDATTDFLKIFNRFEMKFDYLMDDIFFEDLDENDLKDTIIQTKTSNNKILLIFFQNKGGFREYEKSIRRRKKHLAKIIIWYILKFSDLKITLKGGKK